MEEKLSYMKNNADWFRKVLMFEPRGNDIMSGTLITEPCTPGTDVGVLYFEASDWMPMCGHDTMGVTVALIEDGLVEVGRTDYPNQAGYSSRGCERGSKGH